MRECEFTFTALEIHVIKIYFGKIDSAGWKDHQVYYNVKKSKDIEYLWANAYKCISITKEIYKNPIAMFYSGNWDEFCSNSLPKLFQLMPCSKADSFLGSDIGSKLSVVEILAPPCFTLAKFNLIYLTIHNF